MVEALRERADVRDTRALYLRAEGARDALADGLRALGARVDDVAVYRSVPDTDGERVTREALERGVDLVTFTSASTVRNFVSAVGASSAARVRAVTIGPITSAAASALGINVAVEARAATLDALVDAVLEALA
jgi:uroporphyrinogen-III synthase